MNPQDPLAALHPLREPLPIGLWPPAPGWWVLGLLCLLALLVLLWWLRKRHRASAYRREALNELGDLKLQYLQDADAKAYLAKANALLKSAALIAYPRRQVAASSGAQWLHFLNSSAAEGTGFPDVFVHGAYRLEPQDINIEQIHRAASHWIKHHRVAS
ncbi:MAG: DUF4381 domain-containing protein [Pseudomonadota bacterium]